MADRIGIVVHAERGPGVLHQITGVIARHNGDIATVDILSSHPPETRIYFEIELPSETPALIDEIRALPVVDTALVVKSLHKIFGKRIIIVGGGAQVGQVALGAISEADRHNIRGEHISVDTMPIVGEQPLAEAVRAVGNLPELEPSCWPVRSWAARLLTQSRRSGTRDCS